MDSEFFAVYRGEDGEPIKFPLVRDNLGSYRLGCADGLRPVRWWVEGLEFSHFEMADPSRSSQYLNQVLTPPVRKGRPAEGSSSLNDKGEKQA
jgi:hypothetical protein